MNEQQARLEMVSLAKSLFDRGYATGGAGNLSCCLDDERILVTPTGSSLGRLSAERLSVVDKNGTHLSGDKPSKEVVFHLAIYRNNPAHRAIVHLHSTYLTALSCLKNINTDNAIRPFTPYYVMRIGQLPVIPYYNPGHPHIARDLAEKAHLYQAFLLQNHGPVVAGDSLEEAVNNAEELEETARLYFLLHQHDIHYIGDTDIQQLALMKK